MNSHEAHPKRWLLLILLVLSIFIGYLARMSISVALPFVSLDMGWSIRDQGSFGGVLLGIFLVSYGFSNIFFSPLIDIHGAKKMLTIAILVWSVAIFMGALWGYIYSMFLLSRVILGIGQGVLFPSATKLTAEWFPPGERGRANSIFVSGGPMGVMMAPVLMMPFILRTGWESSFYMIGILGILLTVPILTLIPKGNSNNYRSPNPVIDDMKTLMKERDFQLILLVTTFSTALWWGMSLWVPTYLVEGHGIALEDVTLGASLPYVGAVLGMYIGSWISDITGKRKTVIVGSLSAAGLFLVLLTLLPITSHTVVILLLFLSFFFSQMGPPLYFTLIQTKSPPETLGAATGVMNGVCNGLGVSGPLLVGFVVAVTASYNFGILSLSLFAFMGAITFKYFPE